MSKKSLLLNRSLLISSVRENPAIWDKTMKIYRCKRAKADAWRRICKVLNKDFDRMEPIQKKEYFKKILRIWTHIRDNWMKSLKDKRNEKELIKPYVHHEQLVFLKKIISSSSDHKTIFRIDDTELETDEEEEMDNENAGTSGCPMDLQEMIEDNKPKERTEKTLIINRSELINLVRDRPAIWDRTSEIYRNKQAKAEAWHEICLSMNKYYEQMNQNRRKVYLKVVIRVWTQLRDTWMRSIKNKPNRPYKYHEEMLYLMKIIDSSYVLENMEIPGDNEQETTVDDDNERESVDTSCSSMKRQKCDEVDREYLVFADTQTKNKSSQTESEDRNYSFFKSIQPTLAFFDDDQILQFQAGTISLLQRIKKRQNYNDVQQNCARPIRSSRISDEASSSLSEDPIKIETYDIT